MTSRRDTNGMAEQKWVKSSHSSNEGPNCVEVAYSSNTVHVRDSTNPHGPRLTFTPTAWTAFLTFTTGTR